ncbi:hypothetical protein [Bacillus nakamurai]|nr:hypothetical protein [Bacillus nakamurai]MCP6682141.1 hypothetical protein [Bacillus nakamurai]
MGLFFIDLVRYYKRKNDLDSAADFSILRQKDMNPLLLMKEQQGFYMGN